MICSHSHFPAFNTVRNDQVSQKIPFRSLGASIWGVFRFFLCPPVNKLTTHCGTCVRNTHNTHSASFWCQLFFRQQSTCFACRQSVCPTRPTDKRKPKPTNRLRTRVRQTFDTFAVVWRDDLKVRSIPNSREVPLGIMNPPSLLFYFVPLPEVEKAGRRKISRCERHRQWEYCMLIAKNKVKLERQQFQDGCVFFITFVQKYFNCFRHTGVSSERRDGSYKQRRIFWNGIYNHSYRNEVSNGFPFHK